MGKSWRQNLSDRGGRRWRSPGQPLTKDLTPEIRAAVEPPTRAPKARRRLLIVGVTICVLPKGASRHCSPSRSHFVHDLVGSNSGGDGDLGIICLLDDNDHAFATGLACAHSFLLFDTKTQSSKTSKKKATSRTAHIALVGPKSVLSPTLGSWKAPTRFV